MSQRSLDGDLCKSYHVWHDRYCSSFLPSFDLIHAVAEAITLNAIVQYSSGIFSSTRGFSQIVALLT